MDNDWNEGDRQSWLVMFDRGGWEEWVGTWASRILTLAFIGGLVWAMLDINYLIGFLR